MIRELIHDPVFLAQKSEPATREDAAVVCDLLDTLAAHRETCVGMAANMIGVRRRILVFCDGKRDVAMINPEILHRDAPYNTEEGCLSLLGGPRPVKRYKRIRVRYQTPDGKTRTGVYEGFPAQIILHEMDHFEGILI